MEKFQFFIYQCLNPDCSFRFPITVDVGKKTSVQACPRCHGQIKVSLHRELQHESQLFTEVHAFPNRQVLLDNLRSAWNVGSIVRTADGLGFAKIHICGITPPLTHPNVGKTALGAQEKMAWEYHPNAIIAADRLLTEGWRLWALEETPQARVLGRMEKLPADERIVLVAGNEQSGVDPALLKRSERIYQIPMQGLKRSINVAVAFGMAAYLLCAQ